MKVTFTDLSVPSSGVVVVLAADERVLSPTAQMLDKALDGALTRAMRAGRFKGKVGETLDLVAPHGSDYDRVMLVGMGKAKDFKLLTALNLGGGLVPALNAAAVRKAAVIVDPVEGVAELGFAGPAHVGQGALLRSYRFDKYRTKEKDDQKPTLRELVIACENPTGARREYETLEKVAAGVFYTRDLVSEPANIIYPETLAAAGEALQPIGVEVQVLGIKEMEKLGMGALLGVGQGSARESKLLVMQWKGGAKKDPPVAFVGKGVTFDSGGISIKPAQGMEDMKWDMGGAGVVIGLMKALAGRKAKVNAVGVAGLVENMPSATAQRPGDIVTSMSGQTIEVINTDAEGRLVLADALWYAQDRFKPRFMINLATLTGAIIIALGHEHAGLFSNNDELAQRIDAAGAAVGEKVWRLPLADAYDKQISSDAADMKNVGGRDAGSITAAQLLKRFVNDVPWAHLDIAGVTWTKKDSATVPKGGTGFGVLLLNHLVAEHYEG
jgi:leucyl aminopeptidase